MNVSSTPSVAELEPLIALAEAAGRAILEIYVRGDTTVTLKDDRTPLTEADQASHRVIAEGLQRLTPDVPVISEEGEAPDPAMFRSGSIYWLVDPLDGTKEFIKRTGEFTVNIALVRDGRPVAGVVHAPVLGKSWVAGGNAAELRDGPERSPLRVRTANPDRLGVVASRDHAGPDVKALLERVPGAETLSMGSSLKFCLIAEGKADLYLRDGPTMEWDTGAAQAVLEAAGGGVFTLEGACLSYGKPELRNPKFVAVGDPTLDWASLVRSEAPSLHPSSIVHRSGA